MTDSNFQWYSENMWKLRDWIYLEYLDIRYLCLNFHPGIIPILKKKRSKINGEMWTILSTNPVSIPILIENPHQINWTWFSENSEGIYLLKKNIDKIHFRSLCKNKHLETLDLLSEKINEMVKEQLISMPVFMILIGMHYLKIQLPFLY